MASIPIRRAVARVLPGVPHQLCQFHYLREAAKPIYAADRHAKTQLKKHVRGVRPIERALEGRADAEAEAGRGYCLAVRSALTDDGRAPLVRIRTGAARAAGGDQHVPRARRHKKGLPPELARLQRILAAGLAKTAAAGRRCDRPMAGSIEAAHLLGNAEGRDLFALRRDYRRLLAEMRREQASLGALAPAIGVFRKVTRSYWPGLFRLLYDPRLAPHQQRPGALFRRGALSRAPRHGAAGSLAHPGGAWSGPARRRAGQRRASARRRGAPSVRSHGVARTAPDPGSTPPGPPRPVPLSAQPRTLPSCPGGVSSSSRVCRPSFFGRTPDRDW